MSDSIMNDGLESNPTHNEPALDSKAAALVTSLQGELDACRETLLRTSAEFDNYKKRLQKELEHSRKFVLEKFSRELLGVVDSLEFALQPAVSTEQSHERLREGVELTHKLLLNTLTQHGIVAHPVEVGGVFDSTHQEAIGMQPCAQPPGTVVSVVQKGYHLHDRVIRTTKVLLAVAQES